jgi:hypothetical protein
MIKNTASGVFSIKPSESKLRGACVYGKFSFSGNNFAVEDKCSYAVSL